MQASSSFRTVILASSPRSGRELQEQVEATQLAKALAILTEFSEVSTEAVLKKVEESLPEIILVEVEDPESSLEILALMGDRLPEARIFVVSGHSHPQLIINTMRAGAREFLTKPVTTSQLAQAFRRYHEERRRNQDHHGKLYCVTSAKGGSGTTTVAINLSASVAKLQGTRVALVDLGNPLGDAATYLNIHPQFTVTDALEAGERLDAVMLESLVTQKNGFALLAGLTEFRDRPAMRESDPLIKPLQVARQSYSHTLVDLPCSTEQVSLEACAQACDAVVVVLTPELPALWRSHRLLLLLERSGLSEKVRLLVNRSQKSDEIGFGEIQKTLGRPVDFHLPNDYRCSIDAINSGKPLVNVNHSALSRRYAQIARDLTGIFPEPRKKKMFGLFS